MKFSAAATILTSLPAAVSQMKKDYCLSQICSQTILPTPPECQKPTFAEWSACICAHPKWAGIITLCLEECDPEDRGFVHFCPGGSVPRSSTTTVIVLPPTTGTSGVGAGAGAGARSSTSPPGPDTLLSFEPTGNSFTLDSSTAASDTATPSVSVETQYPLAVPKILGFSTSGLFVPLATHLTGSVGASVDTTSTATTSSVPNSSASGGRRGKCMGVGLGLVGPVVALSVCFAFLAGV